MRRKRGTKSWRGRGASELPNWSRSVSLDLSAARRQRPAEVSTPLRPRSGRVHNPCRAREILPEDRFGPGSARRIAVAKTTWRIKLYDRSLDLRRLRSLWFRNKTPCLMLRALLPPEQQTLSNLPFFFLRPNFALNLLPTQGNSNSRSSSDFPIAWSENKNGTATPLRLDAI